MAKSPAISRPACHERWKLNAPKPLKRTDIFLRGYKVRVTDSDSGER